MTIQEAKEKALENAMEDLKKQLDGYVWVVMDVKVREEVLLFFDREFVFIDPISDETKDEWLEQLDPLNGLFSNLINYDDYRSGKEDNLIMRVEGWCEDVEDILEEIDNFIIEKNVVQLGNDEDSFPEIIWRID